MLAKMNRSYTSGRELIIGIGNDQVGIDDAQEVRDNTNKTKTKINKSNNNGRYKQG